MNCCFTGHRDLPIGNELQELKANLRTQIEKAIDCGYTQFIAGGAIGFDMLAGFTVIDLKKEYPFIKLTIMLPCEGYDKFWNETSKRHQSMLLSRADEYRFISKNYYKQCMFVRNRAMVDAASLCIAYYRENHSSGGTAQTVRYAREKGLSCVII